MPKPAPSRLANSYQTFPTASAAAVAALRGITNKQVETGGGILYNKEQNVYAATDPVGQGDGSHFAASVGVPQGWQLHSTYHTHPSGDRSTQFSDNDIATAQQLKAPSYILARDDDRVHVFDPASSKILSDPSSDRFSSNRYSNGSLVNEATTTPPALATAPPPPPTQAPTVGDAPAATASASTAPAATVPVAGARIAPMNDFASRHRAAKYPHKVVRIKTRTQ
jgi:proteasome lid subunit RPN8/RPN11